jgi:hypothetical protein
MIISSSKEYFENIYPSYVGKMRFMPDFFGPTSRYASLHIQENPVNNCLLSGAVNPDVYKIRYHVYHNGDSNKIFHVPPPYPVAPHDFVGDKYARLLNKFQCCVTDGSIYDFAVNKVFEIPAAGSLLLCNQTKDMDNCGFVPGVHYVPITLETSLETIYRVLDQPHKYQDIKRQGREFVLKRHSMDNRFDWLKSVIREDLYANLYGEVIHEDRQDQAQDV